MKNRDPASRRLLEVIENLVGGPPAMDRDYATTRSCARVQHVREDPALNGLMGLQLRGAIQSNLPDVARLRKYRVEQTKLASALVRDLRVEAERRPDAGIARRKSLRATPGPWRSRDRQDISLGSQAAFHRGRGVFVEVKMNVEIDHRMPTARR
jgi:hypothetical protein